MGTLKLYGVLNQIMRYISPTEVWLVWITLLFMDLFSEIREERISVVRWKTSGVLVVAR